MAQAGWAVRARGTSRTRPSAAQMTQVVDARPATHVAVPGLRGGVHDSLIGRPSTARRSACMIQRLGEPPAAVWALLGIADAGTGFFVARTVGVAMPAGGAALPMSCIEG